MSLSPARAFLNIPESNDVELTASTGAIWAGVRRTSRLGTLPALD